MNNWTQPICLRCYQEREPRRDPYHLRERKEEQCCDCGEPTRDGIYYRIDPSTVLFPTHEKEE